MRHHSSSFNLGQLERNREATMDEVPIHKLDQFVFWIGTMKYQLPTNMKAAVARLQHVQGIHGDPAVVEQLKVPVSVPTGPMVKRKFTLVPSHDVEIYLLIFCVSVRFTLGVFSCLRHVLFNPDVNVSRYRRKMPSWERYNREDGEMFSHNRHHLANLRPNPVNMSPDAGKLYEDVD